MRVLSLDGSRSATAGEEAEAADRDQAEGGRLGREDERCVLDVTKGIKGDVDGDRAPHQAVSQAGKGVVAQRQRLASKCAVSKRVVP